jgi:hypothetical protein
VGQLDSICTAPHLGLGLGVDDLHLADERAQAQGFEVELDHRDVAVQVAFESRLETRISLDTFRVEETRRLSRLWVHCDSTCTAPHREEVLVVVAVAVAVQVGGVPGVAVQVVTHLKAKV